MIDEEYAYVDAADADGDIMSDMREKDGRHQE